MGHERPRVLVAGGCHVHAYPIGEQHSFGRLAAEAAGCDYASVSKVSLRNPAPLLEYLQTHEMPDVTVLQLGNYEAPYPIPRHARFIFPRLLRHWKPASGPSSSSRWYFAPNPEASFGWSLPWRVRIAFKQIYAAIAKYTHPPLSDTAAMARSLGALLQRLTRMGVPRIVVLSPFPCADYMACELRLAALQTFEQVCALYGAFLISSGSVLGYNGPDLKRPFDIYIDERHLNLRGHRLLAEALRPVLVAQLKHAPAALTGA